tara:strand:- start:391 stop:516 length:126 start_codon:yes stop_codon:yes gene_type:complete
MLTARLQRASSVYKGCIKRRRGWHPILAISQYSLEQKLFRK